MEVGARREQLIHKEVVPVQGPGLDRAGRGVHCAQKNHLILTGGQGKASRRGDIQDGCPVEYFGGREKMRLEYNCEGLQLAHSLSHPLIPQIL